MNITVVTGPPAEPVTLSEAKSHLRVDHSSEDIFISSLIKAAREWAESFTRTRFIKTTLKLKLDRFPKDSKRQGRIELPMGPVRSITQIAYTDEDGNSQTVSSSIYEIDHDAVRLKYDQEWPDTRNQEGAVEITYIVGYADDGNSPVGDYAVNVPQSIKSAILLLTGHFYVHRETVITGIIVSEVPQSAEYLLWPYRDFRFL